MVFFGYCRVSSEKQNVENNKLEITKIAKTEGYDADKIVWITETISGKKDWEKRRLGEEFKKMKSGDIIGVFEYSRIGRSFFNSLAFIGECRKKGIKVLSVVGDVPVRDDATSNLMLAVSSWKAQSERELIAYRTKVGIAAARERGSILGRKKKMVLENDPTNKERIREDIKKGIKFINIAKNYNCTTVTLRKFVKKHNLKEN